jgi:superfamily II helicase
MGTVLIFWATITAMDIRRILKKQNNISTKASTEYEKLSKLLQNLSSEQISAIEKCTNSNSYIRLKLIYNSSDRNVHKIKRNIDQIFALKRISIDIFEFNDSLNEMSTLILLKMNTFVRSLISTFKNSQIQKEIPITSIASSCHCTF